MTITATFRSVENPIGGLTLVRPPVSWFCEEMGIGTGFDPSISTPTDGQLVEGTLGGDRRCFDELIQRYQRQAVAASYRLVGNSHDALEVTQDAFLKAFAGLAKLNRPEAFGGWLMRIVSNLSLNYRRGRKARSGLGLDELIEKTGESMPPNADPARQVQSREMGERLESALERLPEKQRTALMMFTIDQLPQKQIAEILGCTVEAVKWHVFQGRKRLRELMKGAI